MGGAKAADDMLREERERPEEGQSHERGERIRAAIAQANEIGELLAFDGEQGSLRDLQAMTPCPACSKKSGRMKPQRSARMRTGTERKPSGRSSARRWKRRQLRRRKTTASRDEVGDDGRRETGQDRGHAQHTGQAPAGARVVHHGRIAARWARRNSPSASIAASAVSTRKTAVRQRTHPQWTLSHNELERYRRHGLLPLP